MQAERAREQMLVELQRAMEELKRLRHPALRPRTRDLRLKQAYDSLLRFGGYPEPLEKNSERFWRQWSRSRRQQLLRDDLRDLTRVRELDQVEVLATLIRENAGQLTSQASLAQNIGASQDSVRRWLTTLEALYFCYAIRPWHKNVSRSLRKEPKYFLWDWSQAANEGARSENLLQRFQHQTGAAHAFQVALDLPYVDRDCFEHSKPLIVPARTFLSQLP